MLTGGNAVRAMGSAATDKGPFLHQLRGGLPGGNLEGKSETQIESTGAIGADDIFGHLAGGSAVLAEAPHHRPQFRSSAFKTLSDNPAALIQHEDLRAGNAVRRPGGDLRPVGDVLSSNNERADPAVFGERERRCRIA